LVILNTNHIIHWIQKIQNVKIPEIMIFKLKNHKLHPSAKWVIGFKENCEYIRKEIWTKKNVPYPPVASRNCCRGDQRTQSTDFSCPRSMCVVEPDLRSSKWTLDSPHATATSECWVATGDMSWQYTKLLILKSFTVYKTQQYDHWKRHAFANITTVQLTSQLFA